MRWWPARTPFEVIVGAILTQNTAWQNVEKAIANLRREHLLTPRAIENVSRQRLARLVRPSGYFRQKAKKLKAFVRFLRNGIRWFARPYVCDAHAQAARAASGRIWHWPGDSRFDLALRRRPCRLRCRRLHAPHPRPARSGSHGESPQTSRTMKRCALCLKPICRLTPSSITSSTHSW